MTLSGISLAVHEIPESTEISYYEEHKSETALK